MDRRSVIIIGSGIAGLAASIRLASEGYQVQVFEKNGYAGGKINAFTQDGYQFDEGPSLFTEPHLIEDIFRAANVDMASYFNYKPVEVACTYFYESGKTLHAYTDPDKFAAEAEQVAGEPASHIKNYLEDARSLYTRIGAVFLDHSLHKRHTWLHRRFTHALGALRGRHLLKSLHAHNAKVFNRPELVQLFDRYATYNGSNPYKAPSMLSMIPHLEHNGGVFYPKGGMISISEALHKLAVAKGVVFHFHSPVSYIINPNDLAVGVVSNEKNYFADAVISNMDAYFTYKHLLCDDRKANKLLKQERSSSALIFYWGMAKHFPALGLHNIFFSKDYQAEFKAIFKKYRVYGDPTVYINITSKEEREHARQGGENWFVMVNAPANRGQEWDKISVELRAAIITKLSRMLGEDIAPFIESESVMTPEDIETKTSSFMGSLYGTSSNSRKAAFARHPNFSKAIKGLFFCGGSVHPGGGIPLCLRSGKIAAELVSSFLKKQKH